MRKLACVQLTSTPPRRNPFSPASSIRRPAKSPGGLTNVLPNDGSTGCVLRRCPDKTGPRRGSYPGRRLQPKVDAQQDGAKTGAGSSLPLQAALTVGVGQIFHAADLDIAAIVQQQNIPQRVLHFPTMRAGVVDHCPADRSGHTHNPALIAVRAAPAISAPLSAKRKGRGSLG